MRHRHVVLAAFAAFAAFVLAGGSAVAADASPPAAVAVTGAVARPLQLSAADLKALPATTVHVAYARGHGPAHAVFTGALLWTILGRAMVEDGSAKGAHLRHVILATGSDGYTVAVAMGELDPDFEGKAMVIAYSQDGKPLSGLRLVVPGDHHGGRAVRDLVRIEVQ